MKFQQEDNIFIIKTEQFDQIYLLLHTIFGIENLKMILQVLFMWDLSMDWALPDSIDLYFSVYRNRNKIKILWILYCFINDMKINVLIDCFF